MKHYLVDIKTLAARDKAGIMSNLALDFMRSGKIKIYLFQGCIFCTRIFNLVANISLFRPSIPQAGGGEKKVLVPPAYFSLTLKTLGTSVISPRSLVNVFIVGEQFFFSRC